MRVECIDDCVTAADVVARSMASRSFRHREFTRPEPKPPRLWQQVYTSPIGPPIRPAAREIADPLRHINAEFGHPFFIEELQSKEPSGPSVQLIIAACAEYFNVSVDDIKGIRRTADMVRPRQITMYIAKNLTLRSMPDIGRRLGGRDHTTVLHAFRKIERLLATDLALVRDVAAIEHLIAGRT